LDHNDGLHAPTTSSGLSDDGLHPNDGGYKIMAPLAEKAIAAALKNQP